MRPVRRPTSAEQNNYVAVVFKKLSSDMPFLVNHANHCDSQRRIDRARRTLII